MASSNSAAYYDQDPRDAAGNSQPSAYRNIQQELKKAEEQLHSNIQNLSARGERLDNLQQKTDDLSTSAGQFRSGANRVRKQMWWKDMKMRMCIIIGIVLLLVVIIVPSVIASKHKS